MRKLVEGLLLFAYKLPQASSGGDFWHGLITELVCMSWLGLRRLLRHGLGQRNRKGDLQTMNGLLTVFLGVPLLLVAGRFWASLLRRAIGKVIRFFERRGQHAGDGGIQTGTPLPLPDAAPCDIRYRAALDAAIRITESAGMAGGKADATVIARITYLLLETLYETERRLGRYLATGGKPPGVKS
jgi:hypothetical protein